MPKTQTHTKAKAKTLILVFHPDLARSKANAALVAAANRLDDVEIVDMQALYPSGSISVDTEVRRLIAADRIVLQFPVMWYSPPPILKSWQNAVLTHMFYIAYEDEGRLIEGRPLLVAATAGNLPAAYAPEGVNLFALTNLLRPLQSTAHRCGLVWAEPFTVYEANRLNPQARDLAGRRYAERLRHWSAETASHPAGSATEPVAVEA
ncbi:NAD(P)H-dependent oxidoreductase [Phreatobacter stygius]|uniref:Flavodoxin family protein n=1 Tax=Phreatobacter stygius TaxID=1940610 RepID=A0A4D7B0D1_9HYPH|nr:NAD(P)H-dependent oxidoreductase [Phreatobacter stygius]QCI67114.1 flavodoxin family protein [Phreatobacter stygius]